MNDFIIVEEMDPRRKAYLENFRRRQSDMIFLTVGDVDMANPAAQLSKDLLDIGCRVGQGADPGPRQFRRKVFQAVAGGVTAG